MLLFSSDLSDSDIKRLNEGINKGKSNECWEWQKSLITSGHPSFAFTSKRLQKRIQIGGHRAVALIKYQELDSEDFAMHSCDNPKCCNPNHIIKGNCKQNTQDASIRGLMRSVKGSQHGKAKLTEADVYRIMTLLSNGESQTNIAKRFNVSACAIGDIKFGRRWRHLTTLKPDCPT
jgi:hypothetical protein